MKLRSIAHLAQVIVLRNTRKDLSINFLKENLQKVVNLNIKQGRL